MPGAGAPGMFRFPLTPRLHAMHPTKNSLSAATREKAAGILNQVLANQTDLYSQTKHAHWNVRGPRFWMLHKLFDHTRRDGRRARSTRWPSGSPPSAASAKGTIRLAAANSKLPEFPADLKDENAYLTGLIERVRGDGQSHPQASIDELDELDDKASADLITAHGRGTRPEACGSSKPIRNNESKRNAEDADWNAGSKAGSNQEVNHERHERHERSSKTKSDLVLICFVPFVSFVVVNSV